MSMVTTIYTLYFVGFAVPIVALVGLILAHIQDDGGSRAVATHLSFLKRTFWWGLLMSVLGVLFYFGIFAVSLIDDPMQPVLMVSSFALCMATFTWWFIWTLLRLITGIQLAGRGSGVDETTYLGCVAR